MSETAILENVGVVGKQVFERMVEDEGFRTLLFNDPKTALAEYELSEKEYKFFTELNKPQFDEFAGNLEGRATKGVWRPAG